MQPHQQRVIDEKAELDERLKKLNEFIQKNEIFSKLNEREQSLLINQAAIMKKYSIILGERIALFSPEETKS